MKRFEVGKTYKVNGMRSETITITSRSDKSIMFTGDFTGMRRVSKDDLFGLGENILIETENPNIRYFCFAANEI